MIPQVGDKVVISSYYKKSIDTVAKVTKTQMTTASGIRFGLKTGRAVGDASRMYRRYFHVISPAEADELKREWDEAARKAELVNKLSRYRWQDRHVDSLEKVVALLESLCPTPDE